MHLYTQMIVHVCIRVRVCEQIRFQGNSSGQFILYSFYHFYLIQHKNNVTHLLPACKELQYACVVKHLLSYLQLNMKGQMECFLPE